jgi:glutamine synthetase
MILNTIAAESMTYIADQIEKEVEKGIRRELAINNVVTRELKEHHQVVFNGNGYSEEWKIEAEKRGLKNLRTAPEAIKEFTCAKNIELFEKMKVLSKREVESQQHILYETFSKTVGIEAECLLQMVTSYVVPSCLEYKKTLTASLDTKVEAQNNLFNKYNGLVTDLLNCIEDLKGVKDKAKSFHEDQLHEQATFYRKEVMDSMLATRKVSDALEVLTDDKLWPFPKYSEILFMK